MAFYDTTRPSVSLRRAVVGLLRGLLAWRDDADSRHSLGRLSDRELSDIGLSRGALELSRHDDMRGA